MSGILRANSQLRQRLRAGAESFLNHGAGAVERLLPHIEVSAWQEGSWRHPSAVWTSSKRTEVRITFAIGGRHDKTARSLRATVKRRRTRVIGKAAEVISSREHSICGLIASRVSQVFDEFAPDAQVDGSAGARHKAFDEASLAAIKSSFDEFVVASHLQAHHHLRLRITAVLGALHTLSEQSYENKALTFGCILDPNEHRKAVWSRFPSQVLTSKRYKALSDGFRTAYVVSSRGSVIDFVDLDRYERAQVTDRHFFPEWAESIARASRRGKCGIALSRQGDLLVFDEGSLRFTYRYGRWQYWNHAYLVKLLRDRARAQRVRPQILGRVVGAMYRVALDVSFRRSGGLFVILHNRRNLRQIVRRGDAIADGERARIDQEFDTVFEGHTFQSLSRRVAVELASLDGAVVLENSGRILAYGAVLQPKRSGRLRGTEGSRTKAAIGASNYGLAMKISSDGDISVYFDGEEFIRV